ncbi:MAG: transcription antitermination factor NusB [Gordonia sp. (in: high G+C Gram-positive bacteria)]|uniref:transcription antitermination factor NusB n=1 Tax=Gordonia sp. (in: high G+C Gram-positive bacteria) TaxID=84139 RepID=UPI0039E4161F
MSTADKSRKPDPRGRHRQRRRAVDLLFEADAKGVPATTLIAERRAAFAEHDAVGEMTGYAVRAVEGVTADADQVDAIISSRLQNWKFDRLPAVDRAILRLATWELLYAPDIDVKVVITEAVKLATELSTDDSPAFVNGVLDRIAVLAPQVRAATAEE